MCLNKTSWTKLFSNNNDNNKKDEWIQKDCLSKIDVKSYMLQFYIWLVNINIVWDS